MSRCSRLKFFEKFDSVNHGNDGDGLRIRSQSLCCIVDDVYYLWRTETRTVVKANCSEIWASDDVEAAYEEWVMPNPISFRVTHFTVRRMPYEACIIWGPCGLAVITFPVENKSTFLAKCDIIGELTYIEHPCLNIVQAKWHPTPEMNMVMILNNDNFIRCYDPKERGVVCSFTCAGPLDSIPFRYDKRQSGSQDPSIDFAFGPHLPHLNYWPIFLLKSSGSISYLLMKLIGSTTRLLWEDEKKILIEGEIDDVFEQPATIFVGNSFPLLITVGGLGGTVYNNVLIPVETDTEEVVNFENSLLSGENVLFVKEAVVLESDVQFSFIQILPDPLCQYRFACVHSEGVHLITVNFMPHVLRLLSSDTQDKYADTSSTCLHILYCKDDGVNKSNLVSASFSDLLPQKIVTITTSGETLLWDVPKFIGTGIKPEEDNENGLRTLLKISPVDLNATESVKTLLAKTCTQPYLSLTPELSQEKRETIILESIRKLQLEYIQRQEQAMSFLTAALGNLMDRAEDLKELKTTVLRSQRVIRNQNEQLTRKYVELSERQNQLDSRFQEVISKNKQFLPIMSDAEKEWAKKFQKYQDGLPLMKEQLEGLWDSVRKPSTSSKSEVDPKEGMKSSPRSKTSAIELLDIKREIIQHQKLLAELTHSVNEISGSISHS